MSIVIKGLSMPKNCLLCPCCVGEGIGMGRQHYCQVIDDEPCVSETYRPKNCPLVEIPTPHGRLIDADKLIAFITNGLNRKENPMGFDAIEILTEIEYAPIIIEAEVSE